MNRLEYFDAKVRRVQASCKTLDQKETADRYMELYKAWLELERRESPELKRRTFGLFLGIVIGLPLLLLIVGLLIS